MADIAKRRVATSTPRASSIKTEFRRHAFKRGLIVGVAIVGSAAIYGITQATLLASEHYPTLEKIVANIAPLTSAPDDPGANTLPKDLHITMFYPGESDPEQSWTMQLLKPVVLKEGIEFEGKYTTDHGATGRIRGWKSGSYLVIDYFPATGQPGFGRFMLQQKRFTKGSNSIVFMGTAVGPDCECGGQIVDGHTPIIAVPMTLTANRAVPGDIKDQIMKKRQLTLYEPESLAQKIEPVPAL
jgi:hypothetical protein